MAPWASSSQLKQKEISRKHVGWWGSLPLWGQENMGSQLPFPDAVVGMVSSPNPVHPEPQNVTFFKKQGPLQMSLSQGQTGGGRAPAATMVSREE